MFERHRATANGQQRARSLAKPVAVGVLVVLVLTCATWAHAQSLRGTWQSVARQEQQARRHDFTYLSSPSQVYRFVDMGLLVPVVETADFRLEAVSFPYARPEVRLFIERLSGQFRRACGEQLVVTSLTRPSSHQPSNASSRSVHPTGMAMDLRRPNGNCRTWLENTLLYLEKRGLLEATREYRPSHYHVAVFPDPYRAYVARLTNQTEAQVLASMVADSTYLVRRHDTLWRISQRFGTTPGQIQQANGLRSTTIYPGQVLKIPVAGRDR